VPVGIEDQDGRTNLGWERLASIGILGLVHSPWGIENHGFRTLEMEGEEELAWWIKGMATEVLGRLRLWVYHMVGVLQDCYLRAAR
jgi:hypothetical protein